LNVQDFNTQSTYTLIVDQSAHITNVFGLEYQIDPAVGDESHFTQTIPDEIMRKSILLLVHSLVNILLFEDVQDFILRHIVHTLQSIIVLGESAPVKLQLCRSIQSGVCIGIPLSVRSYNQGLFVFADDGDAIFISFPNVGFML